MDAPRFAEPGRATSRTARRRTGAAWPGGREAAESVAATLVAVLTAALLHDQPGVESRGVDLVAVLVIAVACAPIAFRRTAPRASACVALTVTVGVSLADYPMTACYLFSLALVARATSQADVRLTGSLGVFSGVAVAVRAVAETTASPVLAAVGGFAVGMLPALIGERLRAERARTRDARELARRTDELHDREIQRAVDEERLRIARDVHDITGHHLSAISLRAAGAARTTPDPMARAALDQIHELTGEALGQTKRVLGVLRSSAPAALAPPPRLADVRALMEPARASGVAVEVAVRGDARPLTDTVEVSAYRVIQESVTNVVRHADATTVHVGIDYGPDRLTVTVDDDGRGRPDQPVRPGGGIEGMRERMTILGGGLAAGPREQGGWSVRATLPLESRA
jgi:signal transduction histidine kinase